MLGIKIKVYFEDFNENICIFEVIPFKFMHFTLTSFYLQQLN